MKFIIGALAGLGIGMLLAPDNGKKTREKLNKNLPEYKRQAQEILDNTKALFSKASTLTKEELPQEKPLGQSEGNPSGKVVY